MTPEYIRACIRIAGYESEREAVKAAYYKGPPQLIRERLREISPSRYNVQLFDGDGTSPRHPDEAIVVQFWLHAMNSDGGTRVHRLMGQVAGLEELVDCALIGAGT